MKYVRSKINVQVNLNMTESINEPIIGEINKVETSGDFDIIVVSYIYKSETTDSLIKSSKLQLKGVEIDDFNNMVKTYLPTDYDTMTEREQLRMKYLTGFRLKMAETFNIQVTDTEIFEYIEPTPPTNDPI